MVTAPDVTGKSGALASQMLSGAGLNVQFNGPEDGIVTEQSVPVGTETPMGTIVTVTTQQATDSVTVQQDTSQAQEDASQVPEE